jgi:hypothetical protein
MAAQHEARRQNVARDSFIWSTESFETRKRPDPLPQKADTERQNYLKTYEIFAYGNIHHITNSFCKNLFKTVTPSLRMQIVFGYKIFLFR